MSNYDVALVIDAGTLNMGMTQLFANATAKTTLFKGNAPINAEGVTSIDWCIDAAPLFVLTPPTKAQWDDPNVFSPTNHPKPPAPTDQMFQVTLSSVKTTIHPEQGDSFPLDCGMTVFAEVRVTGNQIVLGSVAVLPLNVQSFQLLYVELVCGIVYTKVSDLLAGYKIPSAISVDGQDFAPPVMNVGGGYLAVASNLTANGTPDISGVTWPQQPFGLLLGRKFLTALVGKYSAGIVQQMDNASVNYSDSNWAGSYSFSGGITNASVVLASTLPNINVTATVSATASVGVSWWLVPGACAIEAASNLL
ncbi:hypothetical protein LMG19083_04761 [Ralstonia psammae]|uniref:Uncharacterized protein n=1 Tax=Ralstonia psammae TaxID=3058598 RepID=A0ABM9JYQ2_9RALS|nr:hypothetical protein [Ralstonia sp. LMG 19083]CAJ0808728.1 hypothetical protein LMG19083_04761 [Ralstonia sp. LMG 19083]